LIAKTQVTSLGDTSIASKITHRFPSGKPTFDSRKKDERYVVPIKQKKAIKKGDELYINYGPNYHL